MNLYVKHLKNSNKKLLNLINIFSKLAGYKINTKNRYLYTNNEQSEKEIRKTIPLTIASKKFKYIGINLMKDVND
jgi:hypothetical protein